MRKQFAIGSPTAYSAPRPSTLANLGALLTATLAMPREWAQRRRQRSNLPRLSDHLLRDMGLERSQVETPGVRPYWRG
ncbi:MAG TPA: DUF1127 domain-containing protein [Dongiaceae bacterium]|jgi:uncharacterized protein YjiS (DUF1127 family)